MYFDSLFAFTGNTDEDGKRKSILNNSGFDKDTFDNHLDLKWVVTEARRGYPKRLRSRNKSPVVAQLSLF